MEKSEFHEAFKAVGLFRRMRWLVTVGAFGIALLGVRVTADGGSVNFPIVVLAGVYAVVFGVLAPRLMVSRALRNDLAQGNKECVVDGTGIAVTRDGAEQVRMRWDRLNRYHETPNIYAVVGRTGFKTCFFVLPGFSAPAAVRVLSWWLSLSWYGGDG